MITVSHRLLINVCFLLNCFINPRHSYQPMSSIWFDRTLYGYLWIETPLHFSSTKHISSEQYSLSSVVMTGVILLLLPCNWGLKCESNEKFGWGFHDIFDSSLMADVERWYRSAWFWSKTHVSEVQTVKTHHWFMCFDKASFSIWSQLQTQKKCSLIEMLVLSGEEAIISGSPITLLQRQDMERLMIFAQINISRKSCGVIITRSSGLSELVASKPSHQQQEAVCGGWAARQRWRWGMKSCSETCGKLKMWNNDFTGPWVNNPTSDWTKVLMHESSISWNPHLEIFNTPLVLMKTTAKPFSQHYTSCPVPGMQKSGHKWKEPYWWAPHDVLLVRW